MHVLGGELVFDSKLSRGIAPSGIEAKSSGLLSGDVSASLEINHNLNKSSHKVTRKEKRMTHKQSAKSQTDKTRVRIKLKIPVAVKVIGILVLTLLLAAGQAANASSLG
jgi:hypothetical protein